MSFAKSAAAEILKIATDPITAARDAAVGEATGADESDESKGKRRRLIALLASLGALGAVGTAGYLGYKNRDALASGGKKVIEAATGTPDNPGYLSRLYDKTMDMGGNIAGGVAGVLQPLAARAALAKTRLVNNPTHPWGDQTLGEKAKTLLQRAFMGKAPQNTATSLAQELQSTSERGGVESPAKGKGEASTAGKLTEFFADPHKTQAHLIAKQLGSKEAIKGMIDHLNAGREDLRSINPGIDTEALKAKLTSPATTTLPAGEGPLSRPQEILARAITPTGKLDPKAKGVIPEASMRQKLRELAPLAQAYGRPQLAAPSRLAGHIGRFAIGALGQAAARAIPSEE